MKNAKVRRRVRSERATPGRRGARLGQHFLTRAEIAARVAESVAISAADTVLEIGPGRGILTRELLKRAGKVVAIEKDTALIAELNVVFGDEIASGRLVLVEQDIREFDPCTLHPTPYSLIANIPYYITGLIIRKFLTASHKPRNMALLVQKEVAERICAKDGKESLLSLSVQAYGTPEYVRTVKAGSFSPPPKVDSAILAIHAISGARFENSEAETRFFDLLHAAFGSKRKCIASTLKQQVTPDTLLRCGIPKTARPEDVRLDAWLCAAGTI